MSASGEFFMNELNQSIARNRETCLPVTVVVPALNEAANIERVMAGYLAQRPQALVVIDDGSSDNTAELAVRAANRRPMEIAFYLRQHRSPLGVAGACNRGLLSAMTEWVVFPSANDGVMNLKPLVEAATRYNWVNYVAGRVRFLDGRKTWLSGHTPHSAGVLWRTSVLSRLGGFNPELGPLCDHLALRELGWNKVMIPEVVAEFRVDRGAAWWRLVGTPRWDWLGEKYFPGDPLFSRRHAFLRRVKECLPWFVFNPLARLVAGWQARKLKQLMPTV